MSARKVISQLMHMLRLPGKRACALLFTACWLLLNAQLALASHHCDLPASVASTASQHAGHMQDASGEQHLQSQTPLCEKHCVPDSSKYDNGTLSLVALPASSSLMLAAVDVSEPLCSAAWTSPPIVGPPAEIQFCRFRE
jgi:hypothetical protein